MDKYFDQEFKQETDEWSNYGEGFAPVMKYPEEVGKSVFKKALSKNPNFKKVKFPFKGPIQQEVNDYEDYSDELSEEEGSSAVAQFRQAQSKRNFSSSMNLYSAESLDQQEEEEQAEETPKETQSDPVEATKKFNQIIIEEITAEVKADYNNFTESIENNVKIKDPHTILKIVENYPFLDPQMPVDDLKSKFEQNFNLLIEIAVKKELIDKESESVIKNQYSAALRRATLSAFLLQNVRMKEDSSDEDIFQAFGTTAIPSLQSWCLTPENNEKWQKIKNEWLNSKSQAEYRQLLFNLLLNAVKGVSVLEKTLLNNKNKWSIPVLGRCLEKLMYSPPDSTVDLSGFLDGALCEYNHQAEKNASKYQHIIGDLIGELKTNVEMLQESDRTNRNWFSTNKKAIDDLTSQISKLKSSIEKINEDIDSITQKSLTLSTYSAKTQLSQLSSQSSEYYKMPDPGKKLVMKTPDPVHETKVVEKRNMFITWGPLEIAADESSGEIDPSECSLNQTTLDSESLKFLNIISNVRILSRFTGISYKNALKIYKYSNGNLDPMLEGAHAKLSRGKDPSDQCIKRGRK